MSKRNNILIVCCMALIAVFCFVGAADAGKDGGNCKDKDNDGYFHKDGCGTPRDCNDKDPYVNPGVEERMSEHNCFDGIDNDGDAGENLLIPSTAPYFLPEG